MIQAQKVALARSEETKNAEDEVKEEVEKNYRLTKRK